MGGDWQVFDTVSCHTLIMPDRTISRVAGPAGEEERGSPLHLGLCWVFFLGGLGAIVYAQLRWAKLQLHEGLPWMLAGISLLFIAGTLAPLRWSSQAFETAGRLRPVEKWFLVVLLLVGGSVRFLGLDHWPPGGYFDELQNHLVAEGILAGDRPIFVAEATQMPALYFYLLAGAIKLAGRGIATVRGVSALFGTLTGPAFYLLARGSLALPVAAACALLLTGSRWHITFSRFGMMTPIVPLVEVLAVLCIWKGMQTGKRHYYLLLGLCMGIGLQTYSSFNLFPAVLLVAVLVYACREGWRSLWPKVRGIARGLIWSLLVAGVLLIPLASFALRNPGTFLQRPSTVAIWNPAHHLPWPGVLWTNTATHLLMFNYRGDGNPRHNIPDAPMLNPIEGVLLAIGLALTLARGLKWPQATWLAWFIVMLLPAILTIESPQAHRAVGAIPAVYLLIGQGLQGFHTLAAHRAGRLRARLVAAVLLGLTAVPVLEDVSRYFRVQVRDPRAWQAYEADYHEIARFIKPLRNSHEIWTSPLYFDYPILKFYLGAGFPYDRFLLSAQLPIPRERLKMSTESVVYVLEPFQKDLFPLYSALYPRSRLEEHRDPFGRVMFVSIEVPRNDVDHPLVPLADKMGFLGAYYPNEQWQGQPAILRREPTVLFHFHWHEEALPGPFTADWSALLHIQEPGSHTFAVTTSGPTLLFVDDRAVVTTTAFEGPYSQSGAIQLSKGDHLLAVRYLRRGFVSTISLTWQPPTGAPSVIPMNQLRPLGREEYTRLKDRLPRPAVE